MLRGSGVMAAAGAVALIAPATAAAARPGVTTGAAANRTQTTAQLSGTVDANRRATTFYFEYGTTRDYGGLTTATPAGRARRPIRVVADVGGLQPYTRYHYRIVAFNADGQARGRDRTFRTRRQPLALTLGATPNPVLAGAATTLTGTLTGTFNVGRQIRLLANPFPYLGGFTQVGNEQLTNATGSFVFPVLSVPVTTQFQVHVARRPEVASPAVTVGAAVRVRTRTQRRRLRRGVSVRFYGRITPARDGVLVEIQKLQRGQWRTVKRTTARHATAAYSRYSKRVRIRRRGRYRVFVNSDGQYVSNAGRVVRVRPRR